MGTVLKGMSRVRWQELTHLYGAAGGVPALLSRVAWGGADAAETAVGELALWLGEVAVFDATVAAVPFLWDLAAAERTGCRPAVLALLTAVLDSGNAARPTVQRDAHRAVIAGRGTAERLTDSGDTDVRAAARELLGAITGHRCDTCAG